MAAADTQRVIETIFRIESPRLIAGLTQRVRDVGLAEELAQDALVIALQRWPTSGVPDNPGAWLMSTAKHRAIDLLRRRTLHEAAVEFERAAATIKGTPDNKTLNVAASAAGHLATLRAGAKVKLTMHDEAVTHIVVEKHTVK